MSKSIGFETLGVDAEDFTDRADEFIAKMDSLETTVRSVEYSLGAKGVCVALTDGRENGKGPKIMVPRSYMAFVQDPFEQQRDKVLAAELNALVIGVDTPGVSISRSTTDIKYKWDAAARGDVDDYAAAQLLAMRQATKIDYENEPIRVLTYSMPNWFVPSLVRSPLAPKIERVDMVEMVNDQPWSLLGNNGLLKSIAAEDTALNHYLGQNFQYPELLQPYDRFPVRYTEKIPGKKLPTRPANNLPLGLGMRKAFAPDLVDAIAADARDEHGSGISEVPIHVWRTEASGVARKSANEETVERLRKVHPEVRLTVLQSVAEDMPMRHAFWHSVPNVAILASAMAEAAR